MEKQKKTLCPPCRGRRKGGLLMFTAKERALLTSPYFRLIRQIKSHDVWQLNGRQAMA